MAIRYAHTNIVARDWRRLARFYQDVFNCIPVPPERDLAGEWLDKVTAISNSHIRGIHLRLPGHGNTGPTLEIFQYDAMPDRPDLRANTPGFGHIAFAVDDMDHTADRIIAAGGTTLGQAVTRLVQGVGHLQVHYLRDPEGNIIEIQKTLPVSD